MTNSTGFAPRILWFTDEFPPEYGGTGAMASLLARGLASNGLLVHVITRQVIPAAPTREQMGNVTVERIPPAGRLKGTGWRAFPLIAGQLLRLSATTIARAPTFDVAIVSGMKIIPLVVVPLCRLLGKKCVVRIESPFELQEPISSESLSTMNGGTGHRLMRLLARAQRAVLRRADSVVAISAEIQDLLLRQLGERTSFVAIPNAVDLARFKPVGLDEKLALRHKLGIDPTRKVFVNVGRITRSKGMVTLMESWPAIVRQHPEVLLVIVGRGTGYWDDCEQRVAEIIGAYDLGGHVLLVGQSDHAEEYFQAADVFVTPSEYEGFALTLVEALGCGLPAITTSVGEAPRLISEGVNGFLCSPKDQTSLTASIEAALRSEQDWPQIGRAARASVVEFDLPRISLRYVQLCHELSSGARVSDAG
jgi:glycosyltransferase involved in cell wall biosynthesis